MKRLIIIENPTEDELRFVFSLDILQEIESTSPTPTIVAEDEHYEDEILEEVMQSCGEAPEFDAEGYPWDGRIHASSKAITNKGVWKLRRGVDDTTIANVRRQTKPSETVLEEPAPYAFDKSETVLEEPAPYAFDKSGQIIPTPPLPPESLIGNYVPKGVTATPPAPPIEQTPQAEGEMNFQQFVKKVTESIMSGLFTKEYADGVVDICGVKGGIMNVMGNPEIIPNVRRTLWPD